MLMGKLCVVSEGNILKLNFTLYNPAFFGVFFFRNLLVNLQKVKDLLYVDHILSYLLPKVAEEAQGIVDLHIV